MLLLLLLLLLVEMCKQLIEMFKRLPGTGRQIERERERDEHDIMRVRRCLSAAVFATSPHEPDCGWQKASGLFRSGAKTCTGQQTTRAGCAGRASTPPSRNCRAATSSTALGIAARPTATVSRCPRVSLTAGASSCSRDAQPQIASDVATEPADGGGIGSDLGRRWVA